MKPNSIQTFVWVEWYLDLTVLQIPSLSKGMHKHLVIAVSKRDSIAIPELYATSSTSLPLQKNKKNDFSSDEVATCYYSYGRLIAVPNLKPLSTL